MKKILFKEYRTIKQLNVVEFSTKKQVQDFINKLEIALPNETKPITVEKFYQIAIGNEHDYVSYKIWSEGGYWSTTDYYDGTEYSGYSEPHFKRINGCLRDVFEYAIANKLISFTDTKTEQNNFDSSYVSVPDRKVIYK